MGGMTATAFEQRVQQAVEALDGWMGEDVARAELAADIYEEVARRAPVELGCLAKLPRREGLDLWIRLTCLGRSAGLHMVGSVVAAHERSAMRRAVRRVQSSTRNIERYTSVRGREARQLASQVQSYG